MTLGLEARRKLGSAGAVAKGDASGAARGTPSASAATIAVAGEPPVRAWSPIVIAGLARMAEFALIVVVGLAIHIAYIVPIEGFEWRYVGAIFAIAVLAMLAFQSADIY